MGVNRHDTAIPAQVIATVQTKLEEASAAIAAYLTPSDPAERRRVPRMGPKSLAFVEKAYDYATSNPSMVPSFLNMTEFGVDFNDAHGMWNLANSIRQLLEAVEDTEMLAGSEAFKHALKFYHAVQAAADSDVMGAQAILDELSVRFPGGSRRKSVSETETVTETIRKKVEVS